MTTIAKRCRFCKRRFLTWSGKARHKECGMLSHWDTWSLWHFYRTNARVSAFASVSTSAVSEEE